MSHRTLREGAELHGRKDVHGFSARLNNLTRATDVASTFVVTGTVLLPVYFCLLRVPSRASATATNALVARHVSRVRAEAMTVARVKRVL